MNEKQDPFEALRRLMALKRHEVPPPGFFDHFSRDVSARLRAGEAEARAGWWERLFSETPWASRLSEALQSKPVLAGGFAVAVCSLLLAAAIYAQQPGEAPQSLFEPVPASTGLASASTLHFAHAANPLAVANVSTNPVLSTQAAPPPSLFDQINQLNLDTQPVDASYSPNGQ